ncbi:MAG TPA: hypothetical protein VGC76_04245 [Pyrinomonadaceae bacterium]|jgi:hypothetical protein
MKNWIMAFLVFLVIGAGIFVVSQRQVDAIPATGAVIIRCERSGININLTSYSSSSTDYSFNNNSSCAVAVARLIKDGFKLQTPVSDSPGAFNYTLVK